MPTENSPKSHIDSSLVVGLDSGSVCTKAVVLDGEKRVLDEVYERHYGQPLETAARILRELIDKYGRARVRDIPVTGTTGKIIAELLGTIFINEVISVTRAVGSFFPDIRTVIEIGGEDSKLIVLKAGEENGRVSTLEDFSMNAACAAGTGSFLDQQASRLGIRIEGEFGELAMKSKNPPRIAGRCSVFAKSDMIHLQQVGTPDYDIVAGLCFAVARNFKSTIAKGKPIESPIVFIGGVAANAGMVRAFKEVLELSDGELLIPPHFNTIGAIGAALTTLENNEERSALEIEKLLDFDKTSLKKI